MMNPIAGMIKKVWDEWDVRVMILLSFFLQIILFMLGNRRKYTVKPWIRILLWLAYLSADWLATAALGKLSSTCLHESAPSNFLRGLWASLLLLHLGGPDTITAYALEDNLLWRRHLVGLVIQAALAIYVIVLSWTRSWLSLLNFPLFLAGIIKYLERTWSLYSASSKDSRQRPPLFDGKILENIASENPESITDAEKIVLAHQWFALKRPDMKNYFSTAGNVKSLGAKLTAHLQDIVRLTDNRLENYFSSLVDMSPIGCIFDIAAIELGFMFDMLYTKAAIIYTKVGCILRLISFFCSSFVLVFFFLNSFSKGKAHEQYSSRVDICITGILLTGAVALEFYALFLILSSDWLVLLRVRYHNSRLLRGIFQGMRWSLLKQQEKKRWSDSMGQFNLLRYCMRFRKGKGTKILQMIGVDEMLEKQWHTSFRDIPLSLKDPKSFPPELPTGEMENGDHSPLFTRGEKALKRYDCTDKMVKDTVLVDLDETIMIWHVATDICYPHPVSGTTDEKISTCKVISDYMMYLLVMKPSMVSQDENFWFDSFCSELRKNLQQNNISLDEATVYPQFLDKISSEAFDVAPSKEVLKHAIRIAEVLSTRPEKWDIMRSVWLEIIHYAAIYCPHACHLQELRQGGEFLSLYWLLANYKYHAAFDQINRDLSLGL